jgi:hypothetical protein
VPVRPATYPSGRDGPLPDGKNPARVFSDPGRLAATLAEALALGDTDGALRCFATDAQIVTPDGEAFAGRDLGPAIRQLTDDTLELTFEPQRVVRVDALALSFRRLRLSSSLDNRLVASFLAVLVMGLRGDGWTITIAAVMD